LRPDPIVTPLTPKDTSLFPEAYTSGFIACASPWIDLCSTNHIVASASRQVLNLEVDYANFCGVRSIIIPGPRQDSSVVGSGQGIAQYARAVQEALLLATRVNVIVHLPMYREPGLEEKVAQLSISNGPQDKVSTSEDIDIYSSWDSWHVIRSACDYDARLFVGELLYLSVRFYHF
jgi:protein arginine N-methyltransferase 5